MLKLKFLFLQVIFAKERLFKNAGVILLQERGKFQYRLGQGTPRMLKMRFFISAFNICLKS